jgi:DNA-binding SARP family transcriptional activator
MEKGEKSKAARHYNAYAKLLEDELGIKPDGRLKDIFLSAK